MKNFIRHAEIFIGKNTLITKIFVVALVIIISYILTKDFFELFKYVKDFYNLFFQLSIGYVISFIFYVMQVYLPNLKQMELANKCINNRIETILSKMQQLFLRISVLYLKRSDLEYFSDADFLNLCSSINQDDYTSALKLDRIGSEQQYYTVKEWILYNVEYVEKEIDSIYKYYPLYVDSELMKIFEQILNSTMHKSMARTLLQMPTEQLTFSCTSEDSFFQPYYNLMGQLHEILTKRKTL